MLKIKIFITLLLALSFTTGFLCNSDDKKDDKKTCGDATNHLWSVANSMSNADKCAVLEYLRDNPDIGYTASTGTLIALCGLRFPFEADFKSTLNDFCVNDEWDQETINCLSGVKNESDIEDCI